jgi:hypothetical protein
MSPHVRIIFALIALGLTSSCDTIFGKHPDISVDDVPVYPNAQNVVREDRGREGLADYISTWSFTTLDTPSEVWQFYVGEMGREWGFYDVSSPQSNDYSLVVKSCPFYYLTMTSTSADSEKYAIVIQFAKEYCR